MISDSHAQLTSVCAHLLDVVEVVCTHYNREKPSGGGYATRKARAYGL